MSHHCIRDALSIKVKEGLSWIHKFLYSWIYRKMQKSFKKTSGSSSIRHMEGGILDRSAKRSEKNPKDVISCMFCTK